jgi:hypothetical protein
LVSGRDCKLERGGDTALEWKIDVQKALSPKRFPLDGGRNVPFPPVRRVTQLLNASALYDWSALNA